MKKTILSILVTALLISCSSNGKKIDLSGEWSVKLDSTQAAVSIQLPGTTDEAGLGQPNLLEPELKTPQLSHLTRKHSYIGSAWYSREIKTPRNWEGHEVLLTLERVLWDTQVWVDDVRIDKHEESLSTPHVYNLTPLIKVGKSQILTIRVDNRKRHDISNDLAHAYTDHTQIKWNGILGEISLEAVEKLRIANMQLYPNVKKQQVKAVIELVNNTDYSQEARLNFKVSSDTGTPVNPLSEQTISITPGTSLIEIDYDMGNDLFLWSEFTPYLYEASAALTGEKYESKLNEKFGMRDLTNDGIQMILNDKPLFLRGTLECCIFPLTGTPPTDKDGWAKVFSAAKEYGMNHLRFHSWCPPRAAFEVADEMGFYLQVELPVWVLNIGEDPRAVQFLKDEANRIIRNYGNHPSFCLWSLGNELQGDFSILSAMVDDLKAKDKRHLYITSSFTFEEGHGTWPEPNDDFFLSQWTKHGWVRGQGVFNQEKPSFDKDYAKMLEGLEVPLITHEIGQYSVYPDLSEISKYTGVLDPLNFKAIKKDIENKGLIDKASDYLKSSGKLAEILYKEEIERALKTPGISGFQLLDLHDFPGQGTALVGLLNAFWESKGIITGEEFREYCSPVVPLLRFEKAVYKNNETFKGDIELCNYGPDILKNKTLSWEITSNGKTIKNGQTKASELGFGYNGNIGKISVPLTDIEIASKLEIKVQVDGSEYKNKWSIWVYPQAIDLNWKDVHYTRNYSEAFSLLSQGKKVLFNPEWKSIKGIEGKFVPVFWSPVHFPKQAGTMGLLCDPSHKALSDFPTDMHTDWQWWDLTINSTTLITDSLKGGTPIVEMIDNFSNNRRLASLVEGKVGKGKMMLATFDLNTDLDNRPAAKQLLVSLLNYMNSSEFDPITISNWYEFETYFGVASNEKHSAGSIY